MSNKIKHLAGVAAGGGITSAGVVRAAAAPPTRPDIPLPPQIHKLMQRANLTTLPPAGKTWSHEYINEQLTSTGLSMDERSVVKNALVRLNLVELGRPIRDIANLR